MKFTRDMLPVLGVKWCHFGTMKAAQSFARWAESSTRRDQYPCEAYVSERDDMPARERFEVKVVNW